MEYFNVYTRFGEKTSDIVERKLAHKKGICHRVFHLWLINSKDEILIQQRSPVKDLDANLWYVSVGGHIECNESIEQAIVREAGEELGLDISHMTDKIHYLYTFHERRTVNDGRFIDNEFYDVFVLRMDAPLEEIKMQESEVQAVKYVNYSDFKKLITQKDVFVSHDMAYKMLVVALDEYFLKNGQLSC